MVGDETKFIKGLDSLAGRNDDSYRGYINPSTKSIIPILKDILTDRADKLDNYINDIRIMRNLYEIQGY
jgi:hypothetical protein